LNLSHKSSNAPSRIFHENYFFIIWRGTGTFSFPFLSFPSLFSSFHFSVVSSLLLHFQHSFSDHQIPRKLIPRNLIPYCFSFIFLFAVTSLDRTEQNRTELNWTELKVFSFSCRGIGIGLFFYFLVLVSLFLIWFFLWPKQNYFVLYCSSKK
jgi:hypothetical protein